jgi:hypothetical protein
MGMPVAVVTAEVAPMYTVPVTGDIINIFLLDKLDAPTRAATDVVLTVIEPLAKADSIVSAVNVSPNASCAEL